MTARLALSFAAYVLVSGCAVDRMAMTEFEQLGDNSFRFKARTDAIYPLDEDGRGEQARMEWLKTYLENQQMCASGFVFDERKVTIVYKAPLATVADIYYRGRCKP